MMKDKLYLNDPELPAKLQDARRNHGGMTVPEGFFADFEARMNAVIDAEAQQDKRQNEAPVVAMPQPQKPAIGGWGRWISVAATVVLVVALGITLQLWNSNTPDVTIVDGLATIEENSQTADDAIELPDHVADEVLASVSDYEVFDLYCDI